MKKLILISILVGLLAAPALAGSSLGSWDEGDPGTTHQYWEFTALGSFPEVIQELVGTYVKAWPNENNMINPHTSKVMLKATAADVGWTEDQISGTDMEIYLEISNFQTPNAYKEIWVDLGFVGAAVVPVVIDVLGDGPTSTYDLLPGTGDIEFGVRIYPNPDLERLWFTLPGNVVLDYVHVDTICTGCSLDVTKKGCVITPGENVCFKGNKVKRMILEYTGQGCGASSHTQDPKKVKCSGDPSAAEPVDIYITDKKGEKNWGWAVGVNVGDHVLADAANEGKDKLDSDTLVIITNAVGDVLQEVQFHTSCSQPLNVGNQFGSMRLFSITTTEGGTVGSDTCITELPGTGSSFDVEYTYTITNNGSTDLTDVTVIDDKFGEHPNSPIPIIVPGEIVTLTLIESLSDANTNTVVVTAAEGCTAQATVTITKAPPEPDKCTTKVQAMLLEYIGPTVSGSVTVTIKADKFKKDPPVIYNIAGDLVPGTILWSVAENDWTIDATAHGQSELGSKTEISINGSKEKIHTSCSIAFIEGKPAPLDKPKGSPSKNWFVVDFEQK